MDNVKVWIGLTINILQKTRAANLHIMAGGTKRRLLSEVALPGHIIYLFVVSRKKGIFVPFCY